MARRRRQSSTQSVRDNASDGTNADTTLDVRVAALERICGEIKRMLDTQFQRIAAVQAQLDHLAAKVTGR